MRMSMTLPVALIVVVYALTLTGCGTESGSSKGTGDPAANPPTKPPDTESGPSKGSGDLSTTIRRSMDKPEVQNNLRNIGQLYFQYNQQRTGPPTLDDFKAYIKKDAPKEYHGLEEGRYVLFVTDKPTLNTVLAHEKNADHNGNRIAVMGDGSVHTMSEQEFQAALKKK